MLQILRYLLRLHQDLRQSALLMFRALKMSFQIIQFICVYSCMSLKHDFAHPVTLWRPQK